MNTQRLPGSRPSNAAREALGIRFKLFAAITVICVVITGLVVGAINMQLQNMDHAALLEAEHFARVIAYTGADNALSNAGFVQGAVDHVHGGHHRDLRFVDLERKGIADTNKGEVVALREREDDSTSAIAGAAIVAYTHAYDNLVRTWQAGRATQHRSKK